MQMIPLDESNHQIPSVRPVTSEPLDLNIHDGDEVLRVHGGGRHGINR